MYEIDVFPLNYRGNEAGTPRRSRTFPTSLEDSCPDPPVRVSFISFIIRYIDKRVNLYFQIF
jgi:hypothetical protein